MESLWQSGRRYRRNDGPLLAFVDGLGQRVRHSKSRGSGSSALATATATGFPKRSTCGSGAGAALFGGGAAGRLLARGVPIDASSAGAGSKLRSRGDLAGPDVPARLSARRAAALALAASSSAVPAARSRSRWVRRLRAMPASSSRGFPALNVPAFAPPHGEGPRGALGASAQSSPQPGARGRPGRRHRARPAARAPARSPRRPLAC